MLYWVAAIEQPTKKEKEEQEKMEKVVFQPKIVVAKDDKSAAIKIVMESEELKGLNMDKIQVVVRPF